MRPRFIFRAVLLCLIAVLLMSTVSVGSGQATNATTSAKKYVVFRCDDVAPNVNFAALQATNRVHSDKNVPITLGIVPHVTAGTGNELLANSQFSAYMKPLASNRLFEFAQHGYTHQNQGGASGQSEFYGRPYAVQYTVIKQGRDDIREAFGVTPTSFIPPFDKSDDNTLRAAQALGFTEYSTSFGDFNVNGGTREGIHIQAVSLALANENLQSAESKTNQFFSNPGSADTFVVLYHPYEFRTPNGSVNNERITFLEDYIDYLKGRSDVQFTALDHSGTAQNGIPAQPANDTRDTQLTATTLPAVQQKTSATANVQQTSAVPANHSTDTGGTKQAGTVLPSVQADKALIEGLRGSWAFMLIGVTSALVLGACLILFRGHMKRLP
ncbi:MAG: DUF2334 domain-containing protein [Halobacteriota archaeon]